MQYIFDSSVKKSIPLYQQAYQTIRKAILMGHIVSGSKIIESVLAEQLKISRTPLREALRQLQKDGLLVSDHTGTYVMNLNEEDFEQLCFCREILEIEIIKLVIRHITPEEILLIEELLSSAEQMIQQGDYLGALESNASFHKQLYATGKNQRLIELLEHVRCFLLIYRAQAIKYSDSNYEIIQEHREILQAVKHKNHDQAIEAVKKHVMGDKERCKKILSEKS